ncbi:MAG: hypothetical protein M3Y81_26415 [Chloroflexota bacterium]|nr:hypothetical protein [Chloroflexota bacterium]
MEARELSSSSGRTRQRKCLLEGIDSIRWALEAGMAVEYVFAHTTVLDTSLIGRLSALHIPCYVVSDGILKKISDTSYLVPCLGVARLPREDAWDDRLGDLVLVLDRVQDHGNIGTIIRTASAFGIRDIVSTSADLDIYYKKIVSASRGTVFDTRLWRFNAATAAVKALQQKGYQVVATSSHARTIQSMATLQVKPIALVVGNETEGVSQEIVDLADVVVQIPMSGMVESLNVGVATGISLYELKFRMVLTMLTNYIRSRLGREVNVASKLIRQAFDARLKQVSALNGTQVVLLMVLKCDEVMTMDQVSKDMTTFGPELDALLAPLFEHGYIQHATPGDSILLTGAGEQAIAQLWSVVERAENDILSDFTADEKTQLDTFLKRIQANATRIVEEQVP